jgi:hypothetical protein
MAAEAEGAARASSRRNSYCMYNGLIPDIQVREEIIV